jgi:hypothetical protein
MPPRKKVLLEIVWLEDGSMQLETPATWDEADSLKIRDFLKPIVDACTERREATRKALSALNEKATHEISSGIDPRD